MADNTVLLPGAGGDTLRDVDKGGIKSQVVLLDIGGLGAESLLTGTLPVSVTSLPLPAGASTGVLQTTGNTSVASIDTKTPALGQALAVAAVPVVLTVIQQTALTPPAAITGFALETGGHLAAIDTSTAKIPSQGQALAASSMPVVLTAAQIVTLTPPAAIAGFATETTLAGRLKPADTLAGITTVAAVTAITNALPAGTNLLGKVGIDQTTPGTTNLVAQAGIKTNNNAAPGVNNEGSLTALGNAAVPAWTEGNLVLQSSDLAGGQRVVSRPMVILGAYRLAAQTAVYAGLLAGAILYSFRWTDATKNCRVTRVRVAVNTITAAGAAGMLDRDLVIVRGFTVADSGGTAITLTGNNQKARTSHATTVVGGIQILSGGALTAGTGTADAQAIGLVTKQGLAAEPPGLTIPPEDLFAYNVGQNYPIVLAANEGFRVRIPTAMPTTIAQRTTVTVEWDEIATATAF